MDRCALTIYPYSLGLLGHWVIKVYWVLGAIIAHIFNA